MTESIYLISSEKAATIVGADLVAFRLKAEATGFLDRRFLDP
jgi:hypothetical protein